MPLLSWSHTLGKRQSHPRSRRAHGDDNSFKAKAVGLQLCRAGPGPSSQALHVECVLTYVSVSVS